MRKTNNIERNRLDYLLTDIMPLEVSELFSFGAFYDYLFSRQKELNSIIEQLRSAKARNHSIPFDGSSSGNWASTPLKYRILKHTNGTRMLNLVQPLAALNMYFFMECYQKEILDLLEENACFSIRYHRKNPDLYYKKIGNGVAEYFQKESKNVDRGILQQTAAYFKVYRYEAVTDFLHSGLWQKYNVQFRFFAKADYKSCFDSIYSHAFKWCIEKDTVDSKDAKNSNLYIVIDRVLQNINGRSSNGVIIGPEFSRMIAEILLQHIDMEVKYELSKKGLEHQINYSISRYVDDLYIFSNTPDDLDLIIATQERVAQKFLLRMNEFKYTRAETPVILNTWTSEARIVSDRIACMFNSEHELRGKEDGEPLVKALPIFLERLKNDFLYLIHAYPDEQRHIVSFILSTLLKYIGAKKSGYALFDQDSIKNAFPVLKLAMYVYSFCPCFEHTQKIISMLVYMDDELHFRDDEKMHQKLRSLIRQHSFIMKKGNLNDLCNWFLFFYEYKLSLPTDVEALIEEKLAQEDNPLLWANYLIYSQYYTGYHNKIKRCVEELIADKINHLGNKEIMLKREFWYVLTFINCPFISPALKKTLHDVLDSLKIDSPGTPAARARNLIVDFLKQDAPNLFFYWGYHQFETCKQLTFRTDERARSNRRKKRAYEPCGSLDS